MAHMKCLDSDFLIDILAGDKKAEHKMREIENDRLATTTINVFEILFGAEYSQNERNIKEAYRILNGLEIFTLDKKDVDILALVLKLQAPLWTEDRDFERIEEITLLRTKDLM